MTEEFENLGEKQYKKRKCGRETKNRAAIGRKAAGIMKALVRK